MLALANLAIQLRWPHCIIEQPILPLQVDNADLEGPMAWLHASYLDQSFFGRQDHLRGQMLSNRLVVLLNSTDGHGSPLHCQRFASALC